VPEFLVAVGMGNAMWAAILDDDGARSAVIAGILRDLGYCCSEFAASAPMQAALQQDSFDMLLIDGDMAGAAADGMLRWIDTNLQPPPAVILMVEGSIAVDTARMSDGMVAKPVDATALLAGVDAVVQKQQKLAGAASVETYGDHVFDVMEMTATVGGELTQLTAKEFGLALLLFRNLNRPLSRVAIMESVWGRILDQSSRTLDAHISQIRNRLGLRPEFGLRLSSIYSFGYRLDVVSEI
jgi:DNA-binding response OmpR family regulator